MPYYVRVHFIIRHNTYSKYRVISFRRLDVRCRSPASAVSFTCTRVDDVQATWLPGYLATWLPGYLATWLPGYLATWLPGYLATWLPGYLAIWLPGYVATWLPGYLATWLPGYQATWLPGYQATWLPPLLYVSIFKSITIVNRVNNSIQTRCKLYMYNFMSILLHKHHFYRCSVLLIINIMCK